jgi:hypothetical protein
MAQTLRERVCGPRVVPLNVCAFVKKNLILFDLEEIKSWNYFHLVENRTGF